MAYTPGYQEDIIICAVCRQVFKDPCTLPCQHTFCRPCIANHIQTGSDVDRIQGLACPFCHNVTSGLDGHKSLEEWISGIKGNPIIERLLVANSRPDASRCSYCKDDCDTTVAVPAASAWCQDCEVYLCDRCLRIHNNIPSCGIHDVSDLEDKKRDEDKKRYLCQEHEDETVRFYCPKCKMTLCDVCVTSHYCDSVVTLDSELLAVRTCLGMRQERLVGQIKMAAMKLDDDRVCLVETGTSLCTVEKEIKSATAYAIEKIKEKEAGLLDEVAVIRDKQMSHLRAEIASGEMAVLAHRQQLEIFSQTMALASAWDMCELYEDVKGTSGELPGSGEGDTSRDSGVSGKFWFNQNKVRMKTALEDIKLGVILRSDRVLDVRAEPVLEDVINTTVSGDRVPWINDVIEMLVAGTETIVVTDFENKSVRSFYPGMGKQCESVLEIGGMPFGLAKLSYNQLAVTVPELQEIIMVEVSKNIVLKSTIKSSKQYWGISSLAPSVLAAGSLSPPCVDLLDLQGNIIRTLNPRRNDKDIIHAPNYLCTTNKGNILVSNGRRSIICMTPEGEVVFHYTPADRLLVSPRGITTTADGDILVVDNYCHRVVRLTDTGQYVGHILTSKHGLKYPHGVYVNSSGRLIVSMYAKGILVFSLVKE